MICGIVALGVCTAVQLAWRTETQLLLDHYACSPYGRIREGVVIAYRYLLEATPQETIAHLMHLATNGDYLQQHMAIATVAEPNILYISEILDAALKMQRIVLEHLHCASPESKNEAFRVLRRTLGYTLSVVTAAAPEQGFALMRECASWHNMDITWVLRENLKKKRLAKFSRHTEEVSRLLA
jgi:hypothetical protein